MILIFLSVLEYKNGINRNKTIITLLVTMPVYYKML
jgi:hypothetical protein